MDIKLAIQGQESRLAPVRTSTYSKRWVEYCQQNRIPYQEVDCYDTAIMDTLRGCDGLLWNFTHQSPTDLLMARHVLYAAQCMGLATFPDFRTCWHFDDKVAQKYLLEAVNAPLIPTYVFYTEQAALDWLAKARFPVVRKLRRGAGSFNVGLIKDYDQGAGYVRKAFRSGFPVTPGSFADAKTRLSRVKGAKDFWDKIKRLPHRLSLQRKTRRLAGIEKGYVLFQEYIPNNDYDTRVAVVGDHAWGYKRRVRKDDFRASGSGLLDCDSKGVDLECVRIAFQVAKSIDAQSICYDFVKDREGRPRIVEISYGFGTQGVSRCSGWWDPDLQWHEELLRPEHAIVEDLLDRLVGKA